MILYILATSVALGALLAQLDDNGNEKAIYYLSQTLVGYELNCTAIERACLVVVFFTQNLCHYMLNHTTYLVAKIDPLKYLLSKAALTSRAKKWVLILSEFDIVYKDRKAIKGQVIADRGLGLGAGILFVTPQGDLIPKSYKISFPGTNNIAEYEGLVTRLCQAIRWNIKNLLVYGDSQLVIKQVTDEYHTKDEKFFP